MQSLAGGRVFVASLEEAEELVRPEAMGAYAQHRIMGILTAAHDVRPRCVSTLPHLSLPVEEIVPTPPAWFDLACRFQLVVKGPLLVHCHGGRNRCRVFAAALLFRAWQMGLEDAIQEAGPPAGPCLESMLAWARGGA